MALLITVATVVLAIFGVYLLIKIAVSLITIDFFARKKWKDIIDVEAITIKQE